MGCLSRKLKSIPVRSAGLRQPTLPVRDYRIALWGALWLRYNWPPSVNPVLPHPKEGTEYQLEDCSQRNRARNTLLSASSTCQPTLALSWKPGRRETHWQRGPKWNGRVRERQESNPIIPQGWAVKHVLNFNHMLKAYWDLICYIYTHFMFPFHCQSSVKGLSVKNQALWLYAIQEHFFICLGNTLYCQTQRTGATVRTW